jgi:hypothetical protein
MMLLGDYNFLGMDLQILLHQIDFRSFLMVALRRIVLAIFVSAATSSTMLIHTLGPLANVDQAIWLFSPFWYSC